jgi:hypothetical protein
MTRQRRPKRKNPSSESLPPDWDARAAAAARAYEDLHGVPPVSIDAARQNPSAQYHVVLGPLTRVCYTKRIRSDLPEHAHLPEHKRPIITPEYCHDYGEAWGSRRGQLSDLAAHDDEGRFVILPRGNNTVTDRGIEDLPAPSGSDIVQVNGRKRARANPVQRGVVLTEIAVRTPSLFGMWLSGVLIGLFGVALLPLLHMLLMQRTRLSPADRGAALVAVGVVGGVLSRRHTRFSAAVTLGGIATAIPLFVEALQLHYATRAPVGVSVDVLPPQTPVE